MIDTLRLKFRYDLPENSSFFSERKRVDEIGVESESSRYVHTNWKWKRDMKKGGNYIPKYWIQSDFLYPDITHLIIEFSAPKLLYGESIRHLKEVDLYDIVFKLMEFFRMINVSIPRNTILQAIPLVVAIGKNIDISNKFSGNTALQALQPLNCRPKSRYRFINFGDLEFGGKEIHFGNRQSTFKIYDKVREVANNAITAKEKKIAEQLRSPRYGKKDAWVFEMIRIELTLKKKQVVIQKFSPYLKKGQEPTLETIFSQKMWEDILYKEVEKIYNHPLKPYIYLAQLEQPVISAYLNKHIKHVRTKGMILYLLQLLQEKGLQDTKKYYFQEYKSRATWYNHIAIVKKMSEELNLKELHRITSIDVVDFVLNECGIETNIQGQLI